MPSLNFFRLHVESKNLSYNAGKNQQILSFNIPCESSKFMLHNPEFWTRSLLGCLWAGLPYQLCAEYNLHIYIFLQSFPFFGVVPAIVDEHGNELEGACEGFLVTNLTLNLFLTIIIIIISAIHLTSWLVMHQTKSPVLIFLYPCQQSVECEFLWQTFHTDKYNLFP